MADAVGVLVLVGRAVAETDSLSVALTEVVRVSEALLVPVAVLEDGVVADIDGVWLLMPVAVAEGVSDEVVVGVELRSEKKKGAQVACSNLRFQRYLYCCVHWRLPV